MTRHPKYLRLLATPLLCLLLLAALCSSAWAQVRPIVKSNVRVLPTAGVLSPSSSGVMRIVGESPTRLAMSGRVPALKPGDVLVSAAGRSSLRKVLAVWRKSTSVVEVRTAQANLSDVFERADIHIQKALGASDFASITPLRRGISVGKGGKSRVMRSSGGAVELVALPSIPFRFNHVEIKSKSNSQQVAAEINGTVNVQMTLDLDMGVRPLTWRFVPRVTADCDLTITSKISAEWEGGFDYTHLKGGSFTVMVGIIPLRITPELVLSFKATGSMESGGSVAITGRAGIEPMFARASNGDLSSSFDPFSSLAFSHNAYSSFGMSATPWHSQLNLWISGLAGPFLGVEAPKLAVNARLDANPPRFSMDADAVFGGEIGFQLSAFGYEESKSVSFPVHSVNIYHFDGADSGVRPTPGPTPTPGAAVARLEVSPSAITFNAGDVRTLSVQAFDGAGNALDVPNVRLTWSSSNPSAATVSAQGLVRGVDAGTAQVSARDAVSGQSASATIIVGSRQSTVTNTNADGIGSLKEAIEYANVFPGTTIKFNIPTSDAGFANGVFTINTSTLPTIASDVTLEGRARRASQGIRTRVGQKRCWMAACRLARTPRR